MNHLEKLAYDEAVFTGHLDPLMSYIKDPDVNEVMINSPDNIWIEKFNQMERLPITLADKNISGAYKALASINEREHTAIMDCRMVGLRVAMAMPPIAVHGPAMSIRKHSKSRRKLDQYLAEGLFEPNMVRSALDASHGFQGGDIAQGGAVLRDFLRWMVQSKSNYILAGSTSAGKTSLLNALISEIPGYERLFIVEDTKELIIELLNFVQVEANPLLGVTMANLVKLGLRFRPDRIFFGEVRGAEACDLMDALNSGHSGSGASLHSDSAGQTLPRLESMIRKSPETANWPLASIRAQIASTFRYVIFCSKFAGRAPESIVEILGIDQNGNYMIRPLYSRFVGDVNYSPSF